MTRSEGIGTAASRHRAGTPRSWTRRVGASAVALVSTAAVLLGMTMAVGADWPSDPPDRPRQVEKTGTSITVKWNATPNANLYFVRFATNASFTKDKVVRSSTTTEQTVNGLKPNTWYYIQVRSARGTPSNHRLLSDYSATTRILTPKYTFDPPTGLRVDYSLNDRLAVSWMYRTNADSYRLRITPEGGTPRYERVQDTSTLRRIDHVVTGLRPGTRYSIAVRGLEQKVDEGTGDYYELTDYSREVVGTTDADVPGQTEVTERPPTDVGLTTVSASSVGLSWSPPEGSDATGYRLKVTADGRTGYRSMTNHGTTVKFTDRIAVDDGPAFTIRKGSDLTFQVASLKGSSGVGVRISDYSSAVTASPNYPQEPPANLRSTGRTGHSVALAWDPVQGAQQYRVDWTRSEDPGSRCEESDGSCTVVTPDDLQNPRFTVDDLDPGRTYYFRVSAIGAGGTISDYQPVMITADTIDDAPQSVIQVPNDPGSATSITLDWSAVDLPGVQRYEVRWSLDKDMKNSVSPVNAGTNRTHRINGLSRERLYYAQVRVVYADGQRGGWSTITGVYTRPVRGTITGSVTDSPGTDSSSETIVYAYDSSGDVGSVARVAADGSFTLWDLPLGSWRLRYEYFGTDDVTSPWLASGSSTAYYVSQARAISVSESSPNSTVPAVTAPAGISISGRVTGAACRAGTRVTALSDNTRVSGAKDTVLGDTRTGSDGRYVINGLPRNEGYWLRFGSTNCGTNSVQVSSSRTGSDVSGVDTAFGSTGSGVVEGLNATEVTSTGARISWTPYPNAARYRVAWWPSSDMPSACEPRCHVIPAGSSISLADVLKGNASGGNTSPTPGETYYLRISAIDANGKTLTSWQQTPLKVALPSASSSTVEIAPPSGVSADDATISWEPVDGATAYRLYWSTSSTMPGRCEPTCQVYSLDEVGGAETPSVSLAEVIGNVRRGGVYYLKISAVGASGKAITGWQTSATRIDLSGAAEALPSTVGGIDHRITSTSTATVTWDAVPTATKYRIYAAPSSSMPSRCEPYCEVIVPADRARPSHQLSGLSGRSKFVKISAITTINGRDTTLTGWQQRPHEVSTEQTVELRSPSGVTGDDATLRWNPIEGAASYRVYWSTDAQMPGRCEPTCQVYGLDQVGDPGAPSISLAEVVGNIRPGGVYFVKISAVGASGKAITGWQSPQRIDLSGAPAALPSTVQDISVASRDGSAVTIGWRAVPTATRYRVYVTPTSSMPSRCEPYCELIVPADRAQPRYRITGLGSGDTRYVKVSAVTTENGKDRTITGWQESPTAVNRP